MFMNKKKTNTLTKQKLELYSLDYLQRKKSKNYRLF